MKKFLRLLLILAGIGIVTYLLTQKQEETRQAWNDIVAKIPGAECCHCAKDAG